MLVIGVLFDVDATQNCPYHQKATLYEDNPSGYLYKLPTYAEQPAVASSAGFNHGLTGGYKRLGYDTQKNDCRSIGGLKSQCRSAKDCAIWYDDVRTIPGNTCVLANGIGHGICCPDLPINRGDAASLFETPRPCKKGVKLDARFERIEQGWVNEAYRAGRLYMESMMESERRLAENEITVRRNSSRYMHSTIFFQSKENSVKIGNSSLYAVFAAQQFVKRYRVKAEQAACILNRYHVKEAGIYSECPFYPECNQEMVTSPYRTITGVCNNVHPPGSVPWGVPNTRYQRALAPEYADGVWEPRRAKNGDQLPPPRLLSLSLIRDVYVPSESDTTWVMQFGQFVDHDMLETAESKLVDGSAVPCCTDGGDFLSEENLSHGKCIPITIPEDDPFYSRFGQRCMEFARSAPACRENGRLGYVDQMNQNTHFLDLSAVYGSDEQLARDLRTFKNGALNVTRVKGKGKHCIMDLPPPDDVGPEISTCALSKAVSGIDPPPEVRCFKAGDNRINVTPYMVASQTVIARQHNRIAEQLAAMNAHWDDERVFQESRRISVAQWQHIVYNEYVPVLCGREKMQQLGMLPLRYGFSTDYDARVNPSILNEFAAAAFRYGHSLVPGKQSLINQEGVNEKDLLLRQHFFKTQEAYPPGNIDKLLIAMATIPGQTVDNVFTEEVTNHLFEEEGKGFGMDLVSLNIQRGRDQGLPGYNEYRLLCGLPRAKHFSDLLDVLSPEIVEKFELLYANVDDIDLYIAGISERPAPGALVGPTFQCIIADQFARLKRGDRYFYDLAGQAGSFTEDQLNEIRKTSYARLICDNSHVQSTQPLIFKSISDANPIVDCNCLASIPRMSLLPWKEVDSTSWNIGQDGVKWFPDCDYVGYEIAYVENLGEAEKCARKCIDTVGCNAFRANGSWCTLKAIPKWLQRTRLTGGICGLLPEKFF